MSPINSSMLARCWDRIYRTGRYATEAPLPFVSRILRELEARREVRDGTGLYVGCGNGRNYRALLDAGLDLVGLDVSQVALADLARRQRERRPKLVCGDFQALPLSGLFTYVVAIQVLQHGDGHDVAAHFARASSIVAPGGLLFVRVNSTAAEIFFEHEELDAGPDGGFSVRCLEGPKRGQPVHFYTSQELQSLTAAAFDLVQPPVEVHEQRMPPRQGRWAQWEAIFVRR